jgi:hypothetical protein
MKFSFIKLTNKLKYKEENTIVLGLFKSHKRSCLTSVALRRNFYKPSVYNMYHQF